jgi:hypothetical protein
MDIVFLLELQQQLSPMPIRGDMIAALESPDSLHIMLCLATVFNQRCLER